MQRKRNGPWSRLARAVGLSESYIYHHFRRLPAAPQEPNLDIWTAFLSITPYKKKSRSQRIAARKERLEPYRAKRFFNACLKHNRSLRTSLSRKLGVRTWVGTPVTRETRHCAICGKAFICRPIQATRCCGRSCMGKLVSQLNTILDKKTCAYCGKVFAPHSNQGKVCSIKCANDLRRKYDPVSRRVRNRLS